jgi:hypothetical protein
MAVRLPALRAGRGFGTYVSEFTFELFFMALQATVKVFNSFFFPTPSLHLLVEQPALPNKDMGTKSWRYDYSIKLKGITTSTTVHRSNKGTPTTGLTTSWPATNYQNIALRLSFFFI